MNSRQTKFCLARTEEYYYEESVNDDDSDEEYSAIFKFIHQQALNRSQKLRITNHVQDVFNRQQIYLDFTSDSLQTTTESNLSPHLINTSSFNRKKYDLVQNQVNYLRPVQPHKQRQSEIFPFERYEQIMAESPFDSPLESSVRVKKRRATVLPGFKPQFFNESTQTSVNKSRNDHFLEQGDSCSSIYRQPERTLQVINNKSFGTQTSNRSIHQMSQNRSQNASSNRSTKNSTSIKNSSKQSSKNSKIDSTLRNLKMNSMAKKSIDNKQQTHNKSNKLRDVSNMKKNQLSNYGEHTNKRKSKSRFYDKTDFISFSKAQIFEPDEEMNSQNHVQTAFIESLMDSSTFKNLNLESLISKKSTTNSTGLENQGQTKHFTGTFSDPTKSNHKSVSKLNANSIKNSAIESIRPIEQFEKLICEIDDNNKIDDLSDVSLILNSTCSQESIGHDKKSENKSKELDNNLELDLSIIGFEASESDIDVVFDNEADESINDRVNPSLKLNEDIELARRSNTDHSTPQLSVGSTSINETLSQPVSIKKSSNSQVEQQSSLNISVVFDSEEENPEKPILVIEKTQTEKEQISICNQQEMNSLKSTPKSILKKNSASKRVWDASEFSLVNLTIGSSVNKSSTRKSSSVRFSDKILKFAPNVSSKRESKDTSLMARSLNESINRSISKTISKSIDEAIDASKNEKSSEESETSFVETHRSSETDSELKQKISMPDLDDCDEELSQNQPAESEEESLNVTIDELSISLENMSEEEEVDEDEENRTPSVNTPETKHQSTFIVKSLKKVAKKVSRNVDAIKKQLPKYYESFVDKTPTIIYPNHEVIAESNVRRSNRIRVRPLDYWRNQQPKYAMDKTTKCLTIEGIEKGLNVDNPFKRKRLNTDRPNKLIKKKNKKSKKRKHRSINESKEDQIVVKRVRYGSNADLSIHQPLNLSAIELSEKIKREASEYCAQNELNWAESKQSKGVYIAFMSRRKDKQGNTQASGFMKLNPMLHKPPQRSAGYVTNYVIMFGAAKVRITEKQNTNLDDVPAVILKSMEGFTVKENALFSIENLRKDELLLYFDVSKV